MNIDRIRLANFRRWQNLDLSLPGGLVAILGRNGAGKSSVLQAIDIAVFGPSSRLKAQLSRGDATACTVEVTLTHGGERYRIRRAFRDTGSRGATSTDFELDAGEETWEPLTANDQATTDDTIRATLGVTQATWKASAYLAQRDPQAFTMVGAKDRKTILSEILALGALEGRWRAVRDDRLALEERAAALGREVEPLRHLAQAVAGCQGNLTYAEANEASMRRQLEAAETAAAAAAEAGAARRVAEANRDAAGKAQRLAAAAASEASVALDRATSALAQHRLVLGRRDALVEAAERLPEWEEKLETARVAVQAYRSAEEALLHLGAASDAAERKVASYLQRRHELELERAALGDAQRALVDAREAARQEGARCRECGQELGREAREASIASMTGQLRENEAAQAALEERLANAAAAISEAAAEHSLAVEARDEKAGVVNASQAAPSDAKEASEQVRQAQGYVAEITRLDGLAEHTPALELAVSDATAAHARATAEREAALAALQAASAALDGLPESPASPEHEVRSARTAVEDAVRLTVQARLALTRAEEAVPKLEALEAEASDAVEDGTVLRVLERAFHRDGVPTMILENAAIPQLEAEANRVLGELGTSYTVELRTQRATQAGGLSETLEVVVHDGSDEQLLEELSGGESSRMDVALRIALARLLAHRRGSDVRVLLVDEPPHLDDAGNESLARVLEGMVGEFDRIVLISHASSLRDAVDQVLTVERAEGETSRLVAS